MVYSRQIASLQDVFFYGTEIRHQQIPDRSAVTKSLTFFESGESELPTRMETIGVGAMERALVQSTTQAIQDMANFTGLLCR